MGRAPWSHRRLVERSRGTLDVVWLRRNGYFSGSGRSGVIEWRDAADELLGRVAIEVSVDRTAEGGYLRISYSYITTSAGEREEEKFDYKILLTATRFRFGGVRWWFLCPAVKDNVFCSKRVGKLYIPLDSKLFACRHCHDLAYLSNRTHDKRLSKLMKDPDFVLKRALEGDLLAIRAYYRLEKRWDRSRRKIHRLSGLSRNLNDRRASSRDRTCL